MRACVCVGWGAGGGADSGGVSDAYLLIQFPPTEGQSDDSVVRQLLSCYLQKKGEKNHSISGNRNTTHQHQLGERQQ